MHDLTPTFSLNFKMQLTRSDDSDHESNKTDIVNEIIDQASPATHKQFSYDASGSDKPSFATAAPNDRTFEEVIPNIGKLEQGDKNGCQISPSQ
jgi:hypothetical protein